jgi:hypothetical protein
MINEHTYHGGCLIFVQYFLRMSITRLLEKRKKTQVPNFKNKARKKFIKSDISITI